jgi:nucleoside 2-deoxyribosyltransferase
VLVYFAGPLFSEAELEFNRRLVARIEALGFDVFFPQRDGAEHNRPQDIISDEQRSAAIFRIDSTKVLEADVLLFVLDGRVPDEGACIELGIAWGDKTLRNPNKRLIGLLTDSRAAFQQWQLNPMVREPMEAVARSGDELLALMKEIRNSAP